MRIPITEQAPPGKQIGLWTVISAAPNNEAGEACVIARCNGCGTEHTRRIADLLYSRSNQCNACHQESLKKRRFDVLLSGRAKGRASMKQERAEATKDRLFKPDWAIDRALLPKTPPGRRA